MTQIEVCHVNRGFHRYITAMETVYIYLKSDLRSARKPAKIAAEIARGGRGPAPRLSMIEQYEARCERPPLTDQPTRGRPFRTSPIGGGAPISDWLRKHSLFYRASVVRKDGPSGVIFYDRPRIVAVRPYLSFSPRDANKYGSFPICMSPGPSCVRRVP